MKCSKCGGVCLNSSGVCHICVFKKVVELAENCNWYKVTQETGIVANDSPTFTQPLESLIQDVEMYRGDALVTIQATRICHAVSGVL